LNKTAFYENVIGPFCCFLLK